MILPALLEASSDTQIKAADFRILSYLYGELILGEYRTVKLWVLARAVHMNKATVSRGLRRLVEQGYLREGRRQEDGQRSYMLVPVRGERAKRSA